MPSEQAQVFAQYSAATPQEVTEAIDAALDAKQEWQDMSFLNRAAIFLRAADLVTGKYRGFVYAVSPFNLTIIGGNLVSAPAKMVYASYLVYKILLEAGLPPNVIQFINGDAEQITTVVFNDPGFSASHFTGSSYVFRSLYRRAADGVADNVYRDYPRLVGETSGKNFHLIHSSTSTAPQNCSACSRLYLPSSSQEGRFIPELKTELDRVKVGAPEESFGKITRVIKKSNNDKRLEWICGGSYDGSTELFIQPTAYLTKSLDHQLFEEELFGPVLTVHVYKDADFDALLRKINSQGGGFALTGAIFARDRKVVQEIENKLRYSAGNFYVNCKTTDAYNDKAGSPNLLMRFTSPRTLKEEFGPLESVLYPSNL
ncbi:delta-1-pyrroline-5-carboxylate dehydrogenase [Ilyonectria destructans]|nr:delta-1-pyrroline-5-carboxylate dehydrogenase [Ilyonectria destructans]